LHTPRFFDSLGLQPAKPSEATLNIVVTNMKGGVGKTTTSVYLAAVAAGKGKAVLLVDADRQGAAAEWLEAAPLEGVEVLEAPSERTVAKAMANFDGVVIVDSPPGDERIVRAALQLADAVVVPTRAGGVEPTRVITTLELIPADLAVGLVVCAARLGTNDLEATIEEWAAAKVPVWGVIPERVGIAAGPAARLYREGIELYDDVYRKATRSLH
jgi:chromosome partitioning protein